MNNREAIEWLKWLHEEEDDGSKPQEALTYAIDVLKRLEGMSKERPVREKTAGLPPDKTGHYHDMGATP